VLQDELQRCKAGDATELQQYVQQNCNRAPGARDVVLQDELQFVCLHVLQRGEDLQQHRCAPANTVKTAEQEMENSPPVGRRGKTRLLLGGREAVLQQSCNRAATELQQIDRSSAAPAAEREGARKAQDKCRGVSAGVAGVAGVAGARSSAAPAAEREGARKALLELLEEKEQALLKEEAQQQVLLEQKEEALLNETTQQQALLEEEAQALLKAKEEQQALLEDRCSA
jgi:hypothetical protein